MKNSSSKATSAKNIQAFAIAKDAFENNFHSRRGIGGWTTTRGKVVGFYVYDNNPWAQHPGLRDEHYAGLGQFMAARGCKLTAEAHYPADEPLAGDAGYTLAMIFASASPAQVADDMQAASSFLYEQYLGMFEPKKKPVLRLVSQPTK